MTDLTLRATYLEEYTLWHRTHPDPTLVRLSKTECKDFTKLPQPENFSFLYPLEKRSKHNHVLWATLCHKCIQIVHLLPHKIGVTHHGCIATVRENDTHKRRADALNNSKDGTINKDTEGIIKGGSIGRLCPYLCGTILHYNNIQMDHVIAALDPNNKPLTINSLNNIVACCNSCNSRKGNRPSFTNKLGIKIVVAEQKIQDNIRTQREGWNPQVNAYLERQEK